MGHGRSLAAITVAAALAVSATAGCGSGAAPAAARTPSNLDVMRTLVSAVGARVLDSAGTAIGGAVVLDVDSSEAAWIARTEFATLLAARGRTVLTAGAADTGAARWNVRGLALLTEYRNTRRPAFFAGAVVDRAVTATLTSEILSAGRVVYSGTGSETAVDTVAEDAVTSLEAGSPERGRGTVPDMQSLDRFVEPLVIIGAAGAAIFLFFQVRS